MPSKTKKGSKHHNSVHVKGGEDLVDLHNFLKMNKKGVFIVVVMMDGCPHCVTLDRDIVEPLLNDSSRKAGIAKIQHTELENTPLKSLSDKIRGYPTVIKVENGSAEEIEDPRNLEAMKETVGATASNALTNELEESPLLEEEAEEARKNNVMTSENIKSLLKNVKSKKATNVPNINEDVLNSQRSRESMNVEFETPKAGKGAAVGGSLYASLLAAGKDLAPAAILSTAAVASRIALSYRKSKRSKRSKRSKKSKTRRNV
jgi:hypothetical protein